MITTLCLFFLLLQTPSTKEWRKIVPLKSTRTDVEQLLGPNDKSYGIVYELTDGVLSIEYSSGPCRKERRGGWNVPEGVVISFSFSAKNKQRAAALRLNRKKFRRVIDTHTHGVTYYVNEQDGITYEIQQGRVQGVEYYPPKRYEHLHCGDPAGTPEGRTGDPSHGGEALCLCIRRARMSITYWTAVIYGDTIKKYYGWAGATIHGSIQSGTAQVELPFPTLFQSFQPKAVHDRMAAGFADQQAWGDAQILIHEAFHLAGYTDTELMMAAGVLDKVQPPDFSNLSPSARMREVSLFWTRKLESACPRVR